MGSQALDKSIVSSWKTPDGRWVRLRPVAPGDLARMTAFFEGLSCATRYFRFGSCGFDLSAAQLTEICRPDPMRCRRFVVVSDELQGESQGETQIACGRLWIEDDGSCDLAIVVADAWQGGGVAGPLLRALIQDARERGLSTIRARVLGSNTRMLALARRNGFAVTADSERAPVRNLILPLDAAKEGVRLPSPVAIAEARHAAHA